MTMGHTDQEQGHQSVAAYDVSPRTYRISLREILVIAFKDKQKILAGFFIPLMLVTLISFLPTPRFTAESTLLVRIGREYIYRPDMAEANAQAITFDRDQAMRSEIEILTSRDVEETVIRQIGLERLYPKIAHAEESAQLPRTAMALREFQKRLDAMLLKDSNVISVSFAHPDPVLAAEVLNRLVDSYLQRRREIFADSKVAFAQTQASLFSGQLQALETRMADFKREGNIVSFGEQRTLLLDRLSSLESRLAERNTSEAEYSGKIDAINKHMAPVSLVQADNEPAVHDEEVDEQRKRLFELRAREVEASSKFTDKSLFVQDLRNEILRAEMQLRQLESRHTETVRKAQTQTHDSVADELVQLTAEKYSLQAGGSLLQQQVDSVRKELAALNEREHDLNDMIREHDLLEEAYKLSAKRLDQARFDEDLDQREKNNVTVVQSALPPIEAKSLQLPILLVGFVLSLCCALFMAFVSELLRDTFLSPEKLQRSLGLPVLVTLPNQTAGAQAS